MESCDGLAVESGMSWTESSAKPWTRLTQDETAKRKNRRTIDKARVEELLDKGWPPEAVATAMGCSVWTVNEIRRIKKYRDTL
jgi:hypothetical protein